jgi:hypothetical protein
MHPSLINHKQNQGRFIRTVWYTRGLEYGNPYFNTRFRVNAPETSVTPPWMYRSEARGNGMMLILIEEDLALLESAALYAELWGGHPGTANKRLSINGRSTYLLPEVGTADGHCTHNYPSIPLKLTDLVNGYNAVQFACDIGTGFWGHYIVDNAALHMVLQPQHPDLAKHGLSAFAASVAIEEVSTPEDVINLHLVCSPEFYDRIRCVHYSGYYAGYDENGNGLSLDWHGFTKKREPVSILGSSPDPPFTTVWDTSMLTAQKPVAVRAVIQFRDMPGLVYHTLQNTGLHIPQREGIRVTQHLAENQPQPFWSRAGNRRKCTIPLNCDPGRIEQAELHVVIWDGGAGTIREPFTINGHPLSVVGSGVHDVLYRKIQVDLSLLNKGENEIVLLSDTEHHGIEILLPGPCLVVRRRV